MLSTKLVQCYTSVVGFTLILINMIFPSKKFNQKSISVDHDELENLQRQISSTFTKVQSCDTFPVSIDTTFSSHVALDVIESQNQRYQDYIKFKVQMKKKQNKQQSSNKSPILNSLNIIENSYVKGQNTQFNEFNTESLSCFNGYNQECCEAQNFDIGSLDSCLENQIQDCCIDNNIKNSCCCKENTIESQICSDINQNIECGNEQNKQQIHQRNPSKNITTYNLNKNYNKQSEAIQDDEEALNEEEDISTEDSSCSNTSDEEESSQQGDESDYISEQNEFQEQLVQVDVDNSYKPQSNSTFQQNLNQKQSSDINIELLNQQVIKNQLQNYFNLAFLQIKKIRFESTMNIQDQFENYCSRKRCPCLKFKRRFQRVRSVQANKKKLPTILENFAY